MAKKEIIIGIDLGTTNSVVSYRQADGQIKVIQPQKANRPPQVSSPLNLMANKLMVKRPNVKRLLNPDTVMSVKRHIGTNKSLKLMR